MSDREDDDRSGGGGGTTSPVLADTAAERRKRLDQERASGPPPPAPRKPVNRRLEDDYQDAVAQDDEAPKKKKNTSNAKESDPAPGPVKKVKVSPVELEDSMRMCGSTSKFLQYDNAHIEESRRDTSREQRTNARLAAGFAEGPGTVEFKIAQVYYFAACVQDNLIHQQELNRTVYKPDGGVAKSGYHSIRSAANSGYRQSSELGEYLMLDPEGLVTEEKRPDIFPGWKSHKEWAEYLEAKRQRGEQRNKPQRRSG